MSNLNDFYFIWMVTTSGKSIEKETAVFETFQLPICIQTLYNCQVTSKRRYPITCTYLSNTTTTIGIGYWCVNASSTVVYPSCEVLILAI